MQPRHAQLARASSLASRGKLRRRSPLAAGAADARSSMLRLPMDDSWRMVVLCALTTAFAYMHRSMLSVAMVLLSNALGWSRAQELYVLSGFYYGYILTQFFGPSLSDAFGAQRTLVAVMVLWCALSGAFPWAAQHSSDAAFALRVLMGAAQGVTFPVVYYILRATVPEEERSRAIAVVSLGSTIGTTATFAAVPALMERLGWDAPFVAGGLVLGPAFVLLWRRALPPNHSNVNAEKASDDPKPAAGGFVAANLELFRHPLFVAIFVAHFTHNLALFGLLAWLPLFLKDVGVPPDRMWMASAPWVAQACAVLLSSVLVDRRVASDKAAGLADKSQVLAVRRRFLVACYVTAAAAWAAVGAAVALGVADAHALLVGAVSLGVAANGAAAASGYEACKLDATESAIASSRLQAMSNMLATAAGVAGVELASQFAWSGTFAALAACFVAAAALFHAMAR